MEAPSRTRGNANSAIPVASCVLPQIARIIFFQRSYAVQMPPISSASMVIIVVVALVSIHIVLLMIMIAVQCIAMLLLLRLDPV